jgi:hypothetical protein
MGNSIAKVAFLWTMFMISLLFGGAYAFLFEKSVSAAAVKALLLALP